jgi:hypothetical protein
MVCKVVNAEYVKSQRLIPCACAFADYQPFIPVKPKMKVELRQVFCSKCGADCTKHYFVKKIPWDWDEDIRCPECWAKEKD